MENYYLIHNCENPKFRVYLNLHNSEVIKKFNEINRSSLSTRKFVLVIEAVKNNVANKSQYNWEGRCANGGIYAIKIDEHRFYTIDTTNSGYKELFISRYGRKQSNQNPKKLKDKIDSISKIEIQKQLE